MWDIRKASLEGNTSNSSISQKKNTIFELALPAAWKPLIWLNSAVSA
jgi:hypothetical protein